MSPSQAAEFIQTRQVLGIKTHFKQAEGLTVSLLPLHKLFLVVLVHFVQPGFQKLINASALSSPASASKLKSERVQTSDVSKLQSAAGTDGRLFIVDLKSISRQKCKHQRGQSISH